MFSNPFRLLVANSVFIYKMDARSIGERIRYQIHLQTQCRLRISWKLISKASCISGCGLTAFNKPFLSNIDKVIDTNLNPREPCERFCTTAYGYFDTPNNEELFIIYDALVRATLSTFVLLFWGKLRPCVR